MKIRDILHEPQSIDEIQEGAWIIIYNATWPAYTLHRVQSCKYDHAYISTRRAFHLHEIAYLVDDIDLLIKKWGTNVMYSEETFDTLTKSCVE